jgi:hypothetical protein
LFRFACAHAKAVELALVYACPAKEVRGFLSAVLRRESSRGWLLAGADLLLTLTHAHPFGRRTELVTVASIALYAMLEL